MSISMQVARLVTGICNRLKMISPDRFVRASKGQFVYGYLPEADFELFALLDREGGLVIDVGANRGHCAIAVLQQTRWLRVCSFEPNPAMRRALNFVKRKFPSRFEYHLCGLGQDEQVRDLQVPVAGRTDISSNASFRKSEFAKDYVQARIAEETGKAFPAVKFTTHPVEILRLDSLGLAPIAIKIDVEGLEREVLEGACKTITSHRPMLMIEINNLEEFLPVLQSLDYRFYGYDAPLKTLVPLPDQPLFLNIICLHPNSPAYDALSHLLA